MRLTIISLTVLFLGYACGKTLPDGVVPQKQMKALLVDMHLADALLASTLVDSARRYRDAYYEGIFDRHGIDSTAFERSIDFYSTQPALMKELYAGIEKQLDAYNLAEQQAMDEKYTAQRKADSIENARRADSVLKVMRDSLDFKRKRYLLYLDGPDSLRYGQPVPVTYTLLEARMLEAVGLRSGNQPGHVDPRPTKPDVQRTVPDVVPPPTARPIKPIK